MRKKDKMNYKLIVNGSDVSIKAKTHPLMSQFIKENSQSFPSILEYYYYGDEFMQLVKEVFPVSYGPGLLDEETRLKFVQEDKNMFCVYNDSNTVVAKVIKLE